MSIHSSLRGAKGKNSTQRNVMKRHERVRYLITNGRWTDSGSASAFGLPKIKREKIKARKAAAKEGAEEKSADAATKAAPAK